MDTNTVLIYHSLMKQWTLETILAWTWNLIASRTLILCQYFAVNHSEHKKYLSFHLETTLAFPSMIYLLEKFTKHNLHEVFEIVDIATQISPTYTIKDQNVEILRGKVYEKELIRFIWVWIGLEST